MCKMLTAVCLKQWNLLSHWKPNQRITKTLRPFPWWEYGCSVSGCGRTMQSPAQLHWLPQPPHMEILAELFCRCGLKHWHRFQLRVCEPCVTLVVSTAYWFPCLLQFLSPGLCTLQDHLSIHTWNQFYAYVVYSHMNVCKQWHILRKHIQKLLADTKGWFRFFFSI